ncbi:MAG: sugar nucleotide-binding protein [Acidimicrobiales bacterium]
MRVWLTGGTGFVGSNIVRTALGHGHDVTTTVHSFPSSASVAYATERLDMVDGDAVRASIVRNAPDVVIHCAILNDFGRLYSDRRAGWDAYVNSTRSVATAARDAGAAFVLVSTDWVFDGTQANADESTPPNPINLYGVLKVASEMVALEHGGAVARVSGVNGLHYARNDPPRQQDLGFGYFVAAVVDALRRGDTFTVWEADDINMVATPSLASECAELILQIGEERHTGVFHCCGAEAVGRFELARRACRVFGLDESRLRTGPPDAASMPGVPIPYDTSISLPRTAEMLRHRPSPLTELLERFRAERELAEVP